MTTAAPAEHILISKTLLWGMVVTILTMVGVGGYYAGQFSTRLDVAEKDGKEVTAAIPLFQSQIAAINGSIGIIKDQLVFLARDRNAARGSGAGPSGPVYGDSQ